LDVDVIYERGKMKRCFLKFFHATIIGAGLILFHGHFKRLKRQLSIMKGIDHQQTT
jgi:hypothetical protein